MTHRQRLSRLAFPFSSLVVLVLSACGGGSGTETSSSATGSNAVSASSGKETAMAVTTASSTFVLRARGVIADNIGPKIDIRIDGVVVASTEVRSTAYQDYSFSVPAMAQGAAIDVIYKNDSVDHGVDRNLDIESITANGQTLAPASIPGAVYDLGTGATAVDGKVLVSARTSMLWNGALRFSMWAPPSSGNSYEATTLDAARLADQATFGPTEALIADIKTQSPAKWIAAQMALSNSHYTLGNGDALHKNTSSAAFCNLPANSGPYCTRDWYSGTPLVWDFYRNATQQPDQLRQRVAFALQQILVVSDLDITGTYGLRNYQNALLDNAFGNYRQVLKKVLMSPVMGDYLNNVNNDKAAPNENMGRELLQLFSIGTCELNSDGSLKGGACVAPYDNSTVRNYAYALTGWTYPAGGVMAWSCKTGTNCIYYNGDMVPSTPLRDTASRSLLSNVTVPAGSAAPQALELVLDSVMAHSNTAPFMSRRFIQHLVSSNPSSAYIQRVASAFTAGRFVSNGITFGAGQRGDLAATIAAVLLDAEARTSTPANTAGKLREPTLMMTGVLRALNGRSDGDALVFTGDTFNQHLFRAPTVFNFYPPDFPVPGTSLFGPTFGIHNTSAALSRLNFLTYLLYTGGTAAASTVPGAFGTRVNLQAFIADAGDPGKLVDRLSVLATGTVLPEPTRGDIVGAVSTFTSLNNADWQTERVKQAAYLVFASPNYQLQR